MDLIIGLVAIILVAYYIVKGYSATGVLMFGGLVLLLISVLMGHSILPENVKSTGSAYFDILEYVKYLLSNRSGGLGLMIMILCGFSAYMTHLGANDMVVKIVSMPLKNIRSPYILMVFAYFLACLMSFAVSSATGLGVLLMATLSLLWSTWVFLVVRRQPFVHRRFPSSYRQPPAMWCCRLKYPNNH